MTKTLKSLLAAATVLLMVGAGCTQSGSVTSDASVETGSEMKNGEKASGGAGADVDAAADAYLGAASEDKASADAEDADAQLYNSTDAEVNAYGSTYDKSELQ